MISGLLGFLADWLAWMVAFIYGTLAAIWGLVLDGVLAVFTAVMSKLGAYAPEWAGQLTGYLPWSTLQAYWADVCWILPVRQLLVIVFAALSTSAGIRLTRWLIGLIPTIEG